MRPALAIAIAYLLGSIPFGYLIVRVTQGGDVRQTGSGGTGATNVSRRAGKGAGVLTLLLDAVKGIAAIVFARTILGWVLFGSGVNGRESTHWWVGAAAIAVLLGHIFPIWLRFRGGKGVATGVGVFLMPTPIAVAMAAVVFVVVVVLTRYVSLGSILAAGSIPVFVWIQDAFIRPVEPLAPIMTTAITGATLIVFAHRGNIRRLLQGNESKFK